MKNPQILLLLGSFIFCHVAGVFDASMRWRNCVEHPYLANKTAHVAYLSKNYVNQFHWKIQPIVVKRKEKNGRFESVSKYQLPKNEPLAPHLLSVCLCRDNFDPLFYMIPYVNSTVEDIGAVCVVGQDNENFTSIGVYDDEEIYDLLMEKYQGLISSSVMEPVPFSLNTVHSGCYDLDHFHAKDVMGHKTCLFSAYADNDPLNDYLYSGPLMSSPLLKQNLNGIESFCYSTVENSTLSKEDKCFYDHSFSKSSFACCCPKNPELCSISQKMEKHYYCFAGLFYYSKNGIYNSEPIAADKYFIDYYKPACTTTLSAQYHESVIKFPNGYVSSSVDLFVGVNYNATDSCQNVDGDKLEIYPSTFCSGNEASAKNLTFAMTKCCSDKDLCNFDLIPREWSNKDYQFVINEDEQNDPPLFVLLNLTIGFYNELNEKDGKWEQGRNMKLFENFNAKFIHESKRSTPEINYLIAQIIRSDSDECEFQIIKPQDVLKYFPLYTCATKNDCTPLSDFECQQSNNQTLKSLMTWFCYVKIIPKQKDEFVIEAGFLEIKDYSPCYTSDIFSDTFCCVNVFEQDQNDTECTMESLTLKYQKQLQVQQNASHELPDYEKTFTEYLQRDIGLEQKCPGKDGCFEIRSLTKSDESQVVYTINSCHLKEPAGCLGLAEDYALDNLDMTNLALGCRADLNSNRCSMVQSPSGEQRIVCCCNHPDENGECKTEAEELPQKIGKPVSSFKTIEL